MAAVPETGTLLLADLTGYTAYLAGAEIEHAPAIAGDLLETIVGRLEPPFRLAKLEGDAAFLFAEDGRAAPELMLDAVHSAYLAFRRRLRSIDRATSCSCSACRTAPRLDLKFFLHHGPYVRSTIAGRDELAGVSVIVVHRLLKGAAAINAHAADGLAPGFAVYTADAAAALGLDPEQLGHVRSSETIEPFGVVETSVEDLEARWAAESATRRVVVRDDEVILDVAMTIDADAETVWEHLTSPALRPLWDGPIAIVDTVAPELGLGATVQCVTGRLRSVEEIVDWQPFDHVGYRIGTPGIGLIEAAIDLQPAATGTDVRVRWRLVGSAPEPAVAELVDARRTAFGRLGSLFAGASPAARMVEEGA